MLLTAVDDVFSLGFAEAYVVDTKVFRLFRLVHGGTRRDRTALTRGDRHADRQKRTRG